MKELFERGILWILLSVLLINFHTNINFTAYILAGFILSCMGIFMEYRYFNITASVCFAILTLFFPFVGIYSGIIWYQILLQKDRLLLYEEAVSFASLFAFLYHCREYLFMDVLFFLITLLSVHMAVTRRELEQLKEQVIHSRDEHVAKQKLLKERYYALSEKQNHEIQVATLSERNRIAREIHDNVGHTLSRSILQLGALLTVYKNTDMETNLLPLKESIDEAMTNIRNSVHNLHRESIDFETSFYRITSEMTGYKMHLFCDLPEHLPIQVTYSFIAILKEALTNIEKHSDADTISITARELSNYYQLIIEDNGHPEPGAEKRKSGIGLKNMEERIQDLQGLIYFSCHSGFRIFISIPRNCSEEKKANKI